MKPAKAAAVEDVGDNDLIELWSERIRASRSRREQYEYLWSQYARLHTNVYRAIKEENDDRTVELPSGDQVKIGLVHKNLEQTLALMETPEISVKAQALDYTQEQTLEDTHRESVVEQALHGSLSCGGLFRNGEHIDAIKRDAMMVGHGIVYSYWRREFRYMPGAPMPVLAESADPAGGYTHALDAGGAPMFARDMAPQLVYQAAQDDHVSPLEFLFEASAFSIPGANWHGREVITTTGALEDQGFELPPDLPASAYRRKTLYGEDPLADEYLEEDAVKHVVCWDKRERQVLHFLETCSAPLSSGGSRRNKGNRSIEPKLALHLLRVDDWPVTFDHPDKSPFEALVLIPANDHPYGISQVEHIKTLALEADKLRTRSANLTRELKRVILYRKGAIDANEIDTVLKSPDGGGVAVQLDEDTTWDKVVKQLEQGGVPPELYKQIAQAMNDVLSVSGVQEFPYVSANTATESELQNQIGGARINRKKRLLLSFLSGVAETHRCLLREFAPPGQPIVVPGLDGAPILLTYGREAFTGRFLLSVRAGDSGLSPARQKFYSDLFASLKGSFGPLFDLALLRESLTLFDIPNVEGLMRAARAGLMGGMAQPALPGAPAPAANPINFTNPQALRSVANLAVESRGARR